MNFLSHYYFERYSQSPEVVLGSVMPDLVKNAAKDTNVWPHKYEDRFGGHPKLQHIYQGWMRHLETDRYFHNAPFFYEHTHSLKVLLAPLVADTPIRPSFLSHIALELLLDHLLLVDDWVRESEFYEYLAAADREAIARFLRLCGVEDTAFFFNYFNSFLRAQYVGAYRDFGQVSSAMINICRRLWDVRLDDSRMQELASAIAGYVGSLRGGFPTIFDDIDSHLQIRSW